MKNTLRTFTLALLALASAGAWAQAKEYKIELSFQDAKAGGKYIFKSKDLKDNFSDTLTLKKDGEKITFKKAYSEPGYITLYYISPNADKSARPMGNSLFIAGPETIKVSGDKVELLPAASLSGGVNDNATLKMAEAKNAEIFRLFLQYRALMAENNKPKADSLVGLLDGISEQMNGLFQQYITANPQSIYSAALLTGMLNDDPKEVEPLFLALSPDVKASKYGKQISEKLEVIKAIQPGRPAPDFTLTDIDGKTLKLSDFRGKWVLLDFWGSWCIWCRKGNPGLVELYEKYGGKDFEIIGLAARDKEENWKKAIADDHLTWRHANLELNEGGSNLPAKYNVAGYPTKILVDPQGNISVVSTGYHEKDDPVTLKMIEELGETYVK